MKNKFLAVSALAFSGTLALNAATVWSQATPGGSPQGQRSGTMPAQPRDSEGGEPILKGQGRGTAGQQGRDAASGRQSAAEASKQPRDAEGGRPWGQTKSTVQGYPKYTQGAGSNQDVREVQEALREKGHNPGPVDGIMGPRTQQALREFQQSNNNLKATGNLDAETAAALGVQIDEGSRASGGTQSQQGTSAKPRQPRDAEGGEPFLQKEKADRGQSAR